jgi:Z1 domain
LASINTKDPKKSAERTAINKAVSQLLGHLSRAQLVQYTATPFANFFVDPDDLADIFPRNFIVALGRPPHYMGVSDFHDVDWNSEDDKSDPGKSNERAYIRAVGPPSDDEERRFREMRRAIDSFVLSGAIKVFREEAGEGVFRHHTMLVHESMETGKHREQADLVRDVWGSAAYGSPSALKRLRELWEDDYRPVCQTRAGGMPVPSTFEDLVKPIGEACRRIREVGDPVLVVNSDADIQKNQQTLDFDRNDVWRILVGGAKLSRGFTVEGLTTSFYTRKALQGDTLMQAGRWFGFRQGYQDLVRLFIRRDPDDAPKRVDLYDAFEGLMRDEEMCRSKLQDYEGFDEDGRPILEPWQVPPIVSQHLPYLKPTARNKMFNAVIASAGDAGRLKDYYGHPARKSRKDKRANYELALPLLKAASDLVTFTSSPSSTGSASSFDALVGMINARYMGDILRDWVWHPDYETEVFAPTRQFYRALVLQGKLKDWVIVWPQLTKSAVTVKLPGLSDGQVVTRNRRQPPRFDFVGSDSKHRDAVERIAGSAKTTTDAVADGLRDPGGRRGAILVYVAGDLAELGAEQKYTADDLPAEPSSHDLVVLFSLVAPATATPHGRSVIEWTVRRKDKMGTPSVDLKKK